MASTKGYLDFILEQLSGLDDISYRPMMGEYLLYYKGKIIGGVYDDRLLLKPVGSAVAYLPDARFEPPYEGARPMLLVDNVDDSAHLCGLFEAMVDNLPAKKMRKE